MDTTEIQADSIEEVAAYSAKEASEKLKCAVVKNDTEIMIDALNGFPTSYTHYAQDDSVLSDITEFINMLVDLGIVEN